MDMDNGPLGVLPWDGNGIQKWIEVLRLGAALAMAPQPEEGPAAETGGSPEPARRSFDQRRRRS